MCSFGPPWTPPSHRQVRLRSDHGGMSFPLGQRRNSYTGVQEFSGGDQMSRTSLGHVCRQLTTHT